MFVSTSIQLSYLTSDDLQTSLPVCPRTQDDPESPEAHDPARHTHSPTAKETTSPTAWALVFEGPLSLALSALPVTLPGLSS